MHNTTEDYAADQTTFRQLRTALLCMCAGAIVLVVLAGMISASL